MTTFTGIILYFLIWWTALFMVLPFGVRQPDDHTVGHQAGAPVKTHLKRKILATTLLAAVLWLVVYSLIGMDVIDFRDAALAMKHEDQLR